MNRKEEHINILMQYMGEGRLEEALNYLEGLSAGERACWEIENITGMICSYCGQYEEAVSFFRKALQSNPDTPDLYYNLADAYVGQQDYEHAELMLKSCEYITEDEQLLEGIRQMREQMASAGAKETKKENSVLMVAYYFPPLSGSGVFRSLKFAKYLPELGWKTSVISAAEPPKGWNYRDDSMVDEIPQEVDVVRIVDEVCTQQHVEITKEKVGALVNFLKDVLKYDKEALNTMGALLTNENGIKQLITFPCASLLWTWEVVRYIEKNIDLNKLDVIYTTSGPASPHLAGFYFNKKYGIPWVADYRDQWTENPYGIFNPADPMQMLLLRLETILLKQANCNITIEQSLVQNYINKFGLKETQMAAITNGYDEKDFAHLSFSENKTKKFTIGYSGLLYSEQRSIVPVLNAIKELSEEGQLDINKVCVRVVREGNEKKNTETVEALGLTGILEQTGYVSHKEALQANLNSDLLLLLVGDEDRFKPVYTGKVFDYLRSGKPILTLGPKDGAVDRLLSATGHGKTFLSTQIAEIKEMILEEYKKWLHAESNTYYVSSAIKVHERKYLTMKLADVFYRANGTSDAVEIPGEMDNTVYNEAYVSGGAGQSYHKHYTQSYYYHSWRYAIRYLLMLNRDISILEIGCGAGQFANMLLDYGFYNYKGFDYAEEGVFLAQKNNPEHKDKFFVADAFKTEEIKKTYELMICFEVLEHIQNDLGVLDRIPKGTKLLLSVPNFDDPYHVRYFSSEKEVYERYKDTMKIFDIGRSELNSVNCLYYIVGEKK